MTENASDVLDEHYIKLLLEEKEDDEFIMMLAIAERGDEGRFKNKGKNKRMLPHFDKSSPSK